MQVTFLLLKRGNKGLDQGDALLRVLRAVHEKSVAPMLLEFRRFLAKCAANALTELQLRSGPGRVEIGEAFSTKVFHLCEELLELSDATGELFNRGGFGTRAGLFRGFCSCHKVWRKSSPASTTWQENMGKWTRVSKPVEAGRCVSSISQGLLARLIRPRGLR